MRRRYGLTLAETIIASCLLGLVVLAMFNLLPMSIVATRKTEHQLRGDQLAEQAIQEKLEADFATLPTTLQTFPPVEEAGVTFESFLQVYNDDPPLLKRIRCVVRWRFADRQREVIHEVYRVDVQNT